MHREMTTTYFYIAKMHDNIEWYLVDVEDDAITWTRRRSKAIKQLNEANVIKFIERFLPTRKEIYIRGVNEVVEISYTDYVPF